MKSIKYYLEFIKENSEEIRLIPVNVDGVKFYHGTIDFEIKDSKDVNPLFRETEEYKKYQQDNWKKRHSGSSDSGIGIYFGKSPDQWGTEDAKQYFDPNAYSGYHTRGFMYEMTLKPGAKVIQSSSKLGNFYINYANLSKGIYLELKKLGVDGVKDVSGFCLINPDVIQTWKEVKRWERPYVVTLQKWNPEYKEYEKSLESGENVFKKGDIIPQEYTNVEEKTFWDMDEVREYAKKYLGEYESVDYGFYPKDENSTYYGVQLTRPETKIIES